MPFELGPDTGDPETAPGTWAKEFPHALAPGGTKFVIVHFTGVSLPAANRLEVDLGYDTDVFTSSDGDDFWTRPVNVSQVGGGTHVPVRYVTDGSGSGQASVDRYGRGESLPDVKPLHDSITNCDPFLPGPWVEPLFPHQPGPPVPKYDPYWICDKSSPPAWENVRCAGAADVRRVASHSVGMIVTVHGPSDDLPQDSVSTCSVTLIDSDLVVLAAHCLAVAGPGSGPGALEVASGSVTFDYEVACDGTVLPAYDAAFYKVIRLVKYRYNDGRDYAILQLRGTPPVPSAPVRNTAPLIGEAVFGVHHPNGAVKKVSPSATGSGLVSSTGSSIGVNLDVAGGSSGSALFDLSGNVVGVLASGGACSLGYSASATMLSDPIEVPDPPSERAVMLVIDRSGSMSESAGGAAVKIDEAQAAAELFISMLRVSAGNQAGLVSFASDASAPVDFPLTAVDVGARQDLIDVLPAISPGGRTSIGDGLVAARDQFGGSNPPRSILVLTDGMENEPVAIADVTGLEGIEITAIGFGTESNLDGARLTDLAQVRGGFYKRAGSGLELRKFFALAFGEIFEAGALVDPDFRLPAGRREGPSVPFDVCEEEALTVVVGWDTPAASLEVEVRTPAGQVVSPAAAGIESDQGDTWRFIRVPLPHDGERAGTWTARVRRARSGSEFPPPDVDVDYFVSVNATGGPSLRPLTEPRHLYTGDVLHPKVFLHYPDESVPRGGTVTMTLRRPAASVGTALAKHGLGPPKVVAGDLIPARQATLMAMEQASGSSPIGYVEEQHELTDDAEGALTFMPSGRFGKRLPGSLVVEGNYTFHAKARFGVGCVATREVQWTYSVKVGIDPDATAVSVDPVDPGSDNGRFRVTITPTDRFGNHVGPGAGSDFSVEAAPGCTPVGDLKDLGDGHYEHEVRCPPGSDDLPGLVVTQPGRRPVVLVPPPPRTTVYRYVAPMVCGSGHDCCGCESLAPGRYVTAIHVVNGSDLEVPVELRFLPGQLLGATVARWPGTAPSKVRDRIVLPAASGTTIDYCALDRLLLGGAGPDRERPMTHGSVILDSTAQLDVSATYTAVGAEGTTPSIDVEVIAPARLTVAGRHPRPEPPSRPVVELRRLAPPPRPQDVAREACE